MSILQVITLLGGVALFLFGMTLMGDGLTHASGSRLEPILFRLSGTPIRALLLGTGVTAVIQSSSATSVMAVGFVNSGMMTVRQAINVILGAILGTSITGWVLCLSYIDGGSGISSLLSTTTLTGIVAVAGVVLRLYSKKDGLHHIGDILMGFAVLMFGMHTMSGAVSDLGEQPWFTGMMTSMSSPFLGILVGAGFTAVLQSASAAVGILQALSVTGALLFETSFPLLLGINIGASIPVLLSAIGATVKGKRAASVYLVASVLGVLAIASIFYILHAILGFQFMHQVMNPFSTALLNTLLRLFNLLILAPFTDGIEAVVSWIIPEKAEQEKIVRLEERFLNHPTLALEQSRIYMDEMAEKTGESVQIAIDLLHNYRTEKFQRVLELEETVDHFEDDMGSYLLQLSSQTLSSRQSEEVSKYLYTLSDFERISDHARNIAECANELYEKQLFLSEAASHDLSVLTRAITEVFRLTTEAFRNGDRSLAVQVEPLEEVIDYLSDEMKMRQTERVSHGQGSITQNFVFSDLITNFERISDHCSNIALSMLRLELGDFETHGYQEQLMREKNPEFEAYFNKFRNEYVL